MIYPIVFLYQFLRKEFLPYFQNWKQSVQRRAGFESKEKDMMMISRTTMNGIEITGMKMSIAKLTPNTLLIGLIYFYSEIILGAGSYYSSNTRSIILPK